MPLAASAPVAVTSGAARAGGAHVQELEEKVFEGLPSPTFIKRDLSECMLLGSNKPATYDEDMQACPPPCPPTVSRERGTGPRAGPSRVCARDSMCLRVFECAFVRVRARARE